MLLSVIPSNFIELSMKSDNKLLDTHISLAHGNGGRLMRELIEQLFAKHLKNDLLDTKTDAALLPLDLTMAELVISTDGFTVEPLEFPGGDIGSLAIHGTVNDLAVSGATPLYLTLNAFIEEGLEMPQAHSAVFYGSGFVVATALLQLSGIILGKVSYQQPLLSRLSGAMMAMAGLYLVTAA